jgi:vacuolar-type H+-ATPase subunit D/Vma8
MNADDLLLMNSSDIIARIGLGMIEKWQDVLHQSAPQLIMELIRKFEPTAEYRTFLDQPIQDQITQLNELAVSRVSETLDPIQRAQQDLINGIV